MIAHYYQQVESFLGCVCSKQFVHNGKKASHPSRKNFQGHPLPDRWVGFVLLEQLLEFRVHSF